MIRLNSASLVNEIWALWRSTIAGAEAGSALISATGVADVAEKSTAARAIIPVVNCIVLLFYLRFARCLAIDVAL